MECAEAECRRRRQATHGRAQWTTAPNGGAMRVIEHEISRRTTRSKFGSVRRREPGRRARPRAREADVTVRPSAHAASEDQVRKTQCRMACGGGGAAARLASGAGMDRPEPSKGAGSRGSKYKKLGIAASTTGTGAVSALCWPKRQGSAQRLAAS